MAVLSNTDLFLALDDGRLSIEPEPTPRIAGVGGSSPFNNTSVDLALARTLQILPDGGLDNLNIDLSGGRPVTPMLDRIYDKTVIEERSLYQLEPNTFLLGETEQVIRLRLAEDFRPEAEGRSCLAGRIEGRSSFARLGLLVHLTAPTIHTGFEGTIKLEMMNLGKATIILKPGLAIAQLIVEEVLSPPSHNESQSQNQGSDS